MPRSPIHAFLLICMMLVIALLLVPVSWLSKIAPGVFTQADVHPKSLQVVQNKPQSAPATFAPWQDAEPAKMPTPNFLDYETDPDTGKKVWRLGGAGDEMGRALNYPDGNGALGILHGQHFYSKVSPVNSNETYVLGAGGQNQPYAALWELETRRLVAWVPAANQEAHVEQRQLMWDVKLPNVYWYTQGNELVRATIDFGNYQVKKVVWDRFADYEYITMGYGEGNFSDDGKRLVITGKSATDAYLYFTPYQVNERRKYLRRQVTSPEQPEFDWAGVDPTGEYILFNRINPERQTVVVPFDQAASAQPRVVYEHMKHSDFVIDRWGEVWIVYGNWKGLFASRLSDSEDRRVWPAGNNVSESDKFTASGHVARVKSIPGQVLVSRHYDGGLYFMNIDQPGYSEYLGNSRHGRSPSTLTKAQIRHQGVDENGEVTFYKREPRGAVSASGRYVFFTADYQAYLKDGTGYDPEPEWCKAYLNMIEL
ncbi:MAG: Unknown protein [uncultured Thiotrichaceae bacterium]|uniref:Uncharacterized protein n=1 Tax=uncultured Thiotrichaceae bacterium TaxID=298394 RepID=A0A6S6SZ59_9GAMM|nr:MAG: Unknown protein [uncultured Thiotrichaceae bacterium]